MRKIRFSIIVICFVSLLICCKKSTTQINDAIPEGAYSYLSYDTNGTAVVSGWFRMNILNQDSISGEWHFKPIGNPQSIGPQTGDGVLIGGVKDESIWLELQPQYRDNNLSLTGSLNGNQFSGQWHWITYIGITNHGNFSAVKK